MDRYTAHPGWIYVGPFSGEAYGIGKGYTFEQAAKIVREVFYRGGHLRRATRDELARRQDFLDRVKAAQS